MSVTVTQNPATYTIARTLADYDVHHSEPPADPSHPVEEPNPRSDGLSGENNPEGWESEYRGVPAYRPTDTTLDFDSRNTPLNRVEGFFVWNMFGGIQMVHVGRMDELPH